MVQEVYDKRTLHHLVGVNPKEISVPKPPARDSSNGKASMNHNGKPSSASNSRAAESVQSAWEEADTKLDSDQGQAASARVNSIKRGMETEEEEGRYGIGRGRLPLKKRRKTGGREDAHTVFTTDDDEEEVDEFIAGFAMSEGVDSIDEEGEYDEILKPGPDRNNITGSRVEERRSYWLSKGIGVGSPGGSDSS